MEAVADKLSVVIGTYHCSVAQFDFDLEVGTCKRRWVDDSSTRSISALTLNGFFCIFGGNDELVRIVNVASCQNVGALHEHEGSITHLQTFQNTHLLSSSDDGKIYIWEIGGGHKKKIKNKKNMSKSWECLCCMHNLNQNNNNNNNNDASKTNNNFNSKILSFSIHPSGRLMISIDNKHQMKIWDLIRAKCIVTILMPKPAIDILWSPNGYNYAIVRENKVLIYKNDGVLYKIIKPINKLIENEYFDRYCGTIVSFTFITHDMVCMADMSARIVVYDLETKTALFRLSGHEDNNNNNNNNNDNNINDHSQARIRNLKVCGLNDNLYLISADNRGRICVWNVHECLNRVIMINSDKNNKNNEDIDIEEDDDDDYMVDENGLFTFAALIQVDTETHITCMDVCVLGRLNAMYKWKKPKTIFGVPLPQDMDEKEVHERDEEVDHKDENDILDSDDEQIKQINIKKKRKKKKKKKVKIDLSRFD